ncbi:hypothetical protein [Mycolicibacter heraklionensis]|uniref:hypothetical protein n=1 Tax=Mycolicibacter heraklionensis TaxID=512402 RepID=UPI0007EAA2F5|nr:hypothetical protein [Mycolicibacter heraklionensis]OBG32408.1 hypothetical protein A5671_07700 [Mycolicibacter heraklionensis]
MTTTSPQLASWLHANISTIAASEDFDLIFTEIAELSRDIQRAVDVPVPLHRFGPCPEMVEADHDEDCDQRHPHQCDTELRGHHRATEVKCDSCGATHPTEGLFERQAEFAGGNSYTLKELTGTILPALGEYVPARTMQHWAATGRLNPTGYTATTATEDAEPRYLLDDIRELWEAAMSEQKSSKAKGKR